MTVTTVYADTADAWIQSTHTVYATARAGTGTLGVNTSNDHQIGQSFFASTFYCFESFLSFDTSAIPDTDVVSAVTLSLFLMADNSVQDFTIQVKPFNWGASVTTADWVPGATFASLQTLATLASSGVGSTGVYKNFTSDASFPAAINKTGTTYLVLSSDRFASATAASTDEFMNFDEAEAIGTTQDPKLVITHDAPSGQPIVMLL